MARNNLIILTGVLCHELKRVKVTGKTSYYYTKLKTIDSYQDHQGRRKNHKPEYHKIYFFNSQDIQHALSYRQSQLVTIKARLSYYKVPGKDGKTHRIPAIKGSRIQGLQGNESQSLGNITQRMLLTTKPQSQNPHQDSTLHRLRQLNRNHFRHNVWSFFPTPPAVIRQILKNAKLQDGLNILEPSAGKGAIAQKVFETWDCQIDCIERFKTSKNYSS